jgi:small neutral amino acid transporter SnatA (MarC family)
MLRLAYAAFKQRVTVERGPLLEPPLKFFVVFFVVVEPISLVPLFSGLTRGAKREYQRRMAVKAVGGSGAHSRSLCLGRGAVPRRDGHQPGSVPDLRRCAASGALATVLLWFGPVRIVRAPATFLLLLAAAAAVLAISLVMMWLAEPLMRVMGVTGVNVAGRLLGVVLGALVVQSVIDGLRSAFFVKPG